MPGQLITRATFGRPNGQTAPVRRYCTSCNCKLSFRNSGTICAPCNNGKWEQEAGEDELAQLRSERLVEIGAVAA